MAALRTTFRALQQRNFRIYFYGQLVSMCGTWLQMVAQGWLVLKLSDNDGVAVGVVTALQTLPALVLGAWGGVLADRFRKRDILLITQIVLAAAALALAVLTWTGQARLWNVGLLVFGTGIATVFDVPARQSLVNEMVPPEEVANAVGLNAAASNGARIFGPAIAGLLLVTLGTGWCFCFNAVSYLAAIGSLAAVRSSDLRMAPLAQRGKGQAREAFRYVLGNGVLRTNILITLVAGGLAFNFPVVLPLFVRVTFHREAGVFSTMNVAMGIGALLGALVAASRVRASPRFVVAMGVGMAVAELVLAVTPSVLLTLPVLVVIGACTIALFSTSNALVQLEADSTMRGRVLAIRASTFFGGNAIGSPLIGWVAAQFGPRSAIALGGVAMAGAIAWYGLRLRSGVYHLRAPAPAAPALNELQPAG